MTGFFEIEREVVYEGPRFSVIRTHSVFSDGEVTTREWIDPGNVVAVLPYDGNHFWLGRQPREPVGSYQLGLCAGKIDPGEDAETAARRELKEEFGFEPEWMTKVDEFYSSEGITNEHTTLFLATGIDKWSSAALDKTERIDVIKVPVHYLPQAIDVVTNAKAKIALLRLLQRIQSKDARRIRYNLEVEAERLEWLGPDDDYYDDQPKINWEVGV